MDAATTTVELAATGAAMTEIGLPPSAGATTMIEISSEVAEIILKIGTCKT